MRGSLSAGLEQELMLMRGAQMSSLSLRALGLPPARPLERSRRYSGCRCGFVTRNTRWIRCVALD